MYVYVCNVYLLSVFGYYNVIKQNAKHSTDILKLMPIKTGVNLIWYSNLTSLWHTESFLVYLTLDTKLRFFVHCTNIWTRQLFKYFFKKMINLVLLESHGWVEYESANYFRKKKSWIWKKMKMKIFNFLFKIATACEIRSQKFQSFLIIKIYIFFYFFYFFYFFEKAFKASSVLARIFYSRSGWLRWRICMT